MGITFGKDIILVSVHPFRFLVEGIAGDRFRVLALVPATYDYHTYELRPRDLVLVSRSRAVLVTGIPVGGWERKLEEVAKDKVYRITGKDSLKDPHLWMSPKRMILVSERVLHILETVDPGGKRYFFRNYKNLLAKLKALDREFSETLKGCVHPYLPEVHPSLRYLALDYSLTHIPLTTGGHHGEVLPGNLSRFIRTLKEKGVRYFFVPEGEDSGVTDLLKEEGLRPYTLKVRLRGGDYFSLMRFNLKVLKEALKCGE
ncbi:MAG: metal ABC transporter substrate-binding protein [Aquificota bacterium]|nr:metal ABC transporter substrate-binding protein [Aquificota bacterium]